MNEIAIAVTGDAWIGGGFGSIETAFRQNFERADNEILLTAYSISSTGDLVFPLLSNALARGVQIKAVINRLSMQPTDVQDQLQRLNLTYRHFNLFDYNPGNDPTDLHAKVIIFDRKIAIVGSSNLSQRGLTSNHEISVIVEGEAAMRVASAVDKIFCHTACRHVT